MSEEQLDLAFNIKAHLDEALNLVRSVPDPAQRFILCGELHAQLQDTVVANGPQGLRGEAARELIDTLGSATMAVRAVVAAGGDAISTQAMNRVAGL